VSVGMFLRLVSLRIMSQVFISYRHTSPDQAFAETLVRHLERHGVKVFVDRKLHVGVKWVEEIECQLRSSDWLVVLLSKESIRSDMVRNEVAVAHKLGDAIRILPIRIAFDGALPFDLAAYLDPIQYAIWRSSADDQLVADQILATVIRGASLPLAGKPEDVPASIASLQSLADVTENIGAPLPAADPRLMFETGAMSPDSPFYIRRIADDQIETQLARGGQTIIVKGMRQMGKSSLLARAFAFAKRSGALCFYLDFQRLDTDQLDSLDRVLRYMARRWAREFSTDIKPDDAWDPGAGAKDNLTDFVEDAILGDDHPVVLFLDESDQVFGYPYRDQFFSLIRAWHNSRATNARWARFSVVVAHSTEPHLWIQDLNQSPFNVGFPIRLDDFDQRQVGRLNEKFGRVLKEDSELRGLIELVGGQPYLIRQALYAMSRVGLTLAALQDVADEESGPFGDHLRRHAWALQKDDALNNALRQILRDGTCKEEIHFQRLRAAGLIRGETRQSARIRCHLYARYFKKH
jgi:hypothetical protein